MKLWHLVLIVCGLRASQLARAVQHEVQHEVQTAADIVEVLRTEKASNIELVLTGDPNECAFHGKVTWSRCHCDAPVLRGHSSLRTPSRRVSSRRIGSRLYGCEHSVWLRSGACLCTVPAPVVWALQTKRHGQSARLHTAQRSSVRRLLRLCARRGLSVASAWHGLRPAPRHGCGAARVAKASLASPGIAMRCSSCSTRLRDRWQPVRPVARAGRPVASLQRLCGPTGARPDTSHPLPLCAGASPSATSQASRGPRAPPSRSSAATMSSTSCPRQATLICQSAWCSRRSRATCSYSSISPTRVRTARSQPQAKRPRSSAERRARP
jgi:hypothetical protein